MIHRPLARGLRGPWARPFAALCLLLAAAALTGCVAPQTTPPVHAITELEKPPERPGTVHPFPSALDLPPQATVAPPAESDDTATVAPSENPAQPGAGVAAETPVITTELAGAADSSDLPFTPTGSAFHHGVELPQPTPSAPPAAEPLQGPVGVALDENLPAAWANALLQAIGAADEIAGDGMVVPLSVDGGGATRLALGGPETGAPVVRRYFAVAVPFDTVQDEIAQEEVAARWQGDGRLLTTAEGAELLPAILGDAAATVEVVEPAALIGLLEGDRNALALIPFDQIDPRFKLLQVDGVNLLSNHLGDDAWPFVVQAGISGPGALALQELLAGAVLPATNRDPTGLTTLVMTGVTAIARGTAAAIERNANYAYPAEIIGPELARADITHVSNEIPFIEGCEVRNFENNLVLCSKPEYWAALELMGTDLVGLSGNHVNDFGREGARESLGWYKENNIPIYGSGLTVDEACAPLLWEHNGNTFAFIAALAFGPEGAWVTDEEPGACYYYEHKDRLLSTVTALAREVDIVAVELQYEETYFASPTPTQVQEFRELRAAGADLVTGVQSHVPQAQEPFGAFDAGGRGFISYGLGNLFFDQMWSWETRSELYLRLTVSGGEIVSAEILTGVLEDYAQPRWATPGERELILTTIFDGAPPRP